MALPMATVVYSGPHNQMLPIRKKLYDLTPVGLEAARLSLSDLRQMARGLEPEFKVL